MNDDHNLNDTPSHPSDTLDSDLIEALCQLRDESKDTPEVRPSLSREQVIWKLNRDLSRTTKQPTKQELLDHETARRKRMELWRPLKKSEGFMNVKADLENRRCRKLCRDEVLTHLLLLYWDTQEAATRERLKQTNFVSSKRT